MNLSTRVVGRFIQAANNPLRSWLAKAWNEGSVHLPNLELKWQHRQSPENLVEEANREIDKSLATIKSSLDSLATWQHSSLGAPLGVFTSFGDSLFDLVYWTAARKSAEKLMAAATRQGSL